MKKIELTDEQTSELLNLLLAALRDVADGCERRLRKGKDQGDLDTLRVCRSAIAKAEGRK